jgi:hypothetical protein
MPKYDRQLVVVLLAGNDRDTTSRRAANDLAAKAAGKGLTTARADVPAGGPVPSATADELRHLSARSRLYLVGVGDRSALAVSGWGPEAAADLLAAAGLTAVGVVSLVADEAGRDVGWEPGMPLVGPGDSFAARFHRRLGEQNGVRVDVLARVFPVEVIGQECGPDRGRKQTRGPDGTSVSHRAESKVRFTWADGTQVRAWVDYGRAD